MFDCDYFSCVGLFIVEVKAREKYYIDILEIIKNNIIGVDV